MRQGSYRFGMASSIFFYCLVTNYSTNAQIVPDATLPVNSTVRTQGSTTFIEEGTRKGGNLFHSFQRFGVPTGTEAFFNNSLDVQNILTRVTGRSISNIDGLIRANGTANLFLINPNGIIFGAGASLNVGGSFIASTASGIKFTDGSLLEATNTRSPPLLTVSVPIGLQYGANPGSIQVQGNGRGARTTSDLIDTAVGLRVQSDRTLALVGGDVEIVGGTLKTAGGRIELGSVAGPGLVSLIATHKGWALDYQGIPTYGDIQLSNAAAIDASGAGGGEIQLVGDRLRIVGGSQIDASTLGGESGGRLSAIAKESLELLGTSPNHQFASALLTRVFPEATGTGGHLIIETKRLLVRDGAQISAATLGAGQAGNLGVKAFESVELIGTSADEKLLSGLFASVAKKEATGNGGEITLETGRLIIREGARLGAFTVGEGNGGNVTAKASESIEVSGTSANGIGIALSARSTSHGNAGNLRIETGVLSVRNRGEITVSSTGSGEAGNLEVLAKKIALENSGRINADTVGGGGNINLRSPVLILRDRSTIATNATGSNIPGGNITIDADAIAALKNSDITANSQDFRGGQITINATSIFGTEYRSFPLRNTPDSDITATGGTRELSGTVNLNTPDINPTAALLTLPASFIDPTQLIARGCPADKGNTFIITGRGGLPRSPNEGLRHSAAIVNWVTLDREESVEAEASRTQPRRNLPLDTPFERIGTQIVEATGWEINNKGQVILTANSLTGTLKSFESISACPTF